MKALLKQAGRLGIDLADQRPATRKVATKLLARWFARDGADPDIVDDVVANAGAESVKASYATLKWAKSVGSRGPMPRGFRPDRNLQGNAARTAALRMIDHRRAKNRNIQLERQRFYLTQPGPDDPELRTFVHDTLSDRINRRIHGGGPKGRIGSDHAMAVMLAVTDRLEAAGMRPFLVSGTLLGAVRQGRLLDYDYDVDLGMLPEDGTVEEVAEVFREVPGFTASIEDHRVFLSHRSGFKVDLFMHYEKDGLYWHVTRIHKWWNTPFDLEKVVLDGHEFWIPTDAEKYLEENYGVWEHPIAWYHMSFDTPNREYRDTTEAVLYLYEILLNSLESGDRWVAENAVRELRDTFDIDLTDQFAPSPLLHPRTPPADRNR